MTVYRNKVPHNDCGTKTSAFMNIYIYEIDNEEFSYTLTMDNNRSEEKNV